MFFCGSMTWPIAFTWPDPTRPTKFFKKSVSTRPDPTSGSIRPKDNSGDSARVKIRTFVFIHTLFSNFWLFCVMSFLRSVVHAKGHPTIEISLPLAQSSEFREMVTSSHEQSFNSRCSSSDFERFNEHFNLGYLITTKLCFNLSFKQVNRMFFKDK